MKPNPRNPSTPPSDKVTAEDPSLLPPLFGNPRHRNIAAGVFLVATLIVFGLPLFNGGDQILSQPGSDLNTVFVGWTDFTFGQMAKGNLPLWNPHLYGGAPCLGGFQEALLYPPSWLHLILSMPQAFNWGIALHVFLAGFFTYLWMARRGLHPLASILAGLVFMFGGGYFMHISAGHLPNLRTMVWVPLILLAIDDLTTTRSLRGAWLGAGAVALAIYAGHVQYVYFTAVIAIPYALLGLWKAPSKPKALAGLALLGIGGAALSAVQLFTGLQAAGESARSKLPIDVARTFAFPPENLLTLAMPHVFGHLSGEPHYWGRWFLWEDSLFIGMTATILAVYGAIWGERKNRRFAVTFLIVSLLLAFGYYTPLYNILYRFLPGISSFRGVSKFAFLAALFLANLAAVGFDTLLRTIPAGKPNRSGGRPLGAGVLKPVSAIGSLGIILVLFGVFIWFSAGNGVSGTWGRIFSQIPWTDEGFSYGPFFSVTPGASIIEQSGHGVAVSAWVAGAAALAVAAIWFAAGFDRRYFYAIGLVAAIELLAFAGYNTPTFDLRSVTNIVDQLHGLVTMVGPDSRAITNVPTAYLMAGGNDAWGNDPMVLRRYADLYAYGQGVSADELLRQAFPANKMGPLWGLIRIKAILLPTPNGMRTEEYKGRKLARAQLIDVAEVIADPDQLLTALADPKFAPGATVLLEKPVSPMPNGSGGNLPEPGIVQLKDRSTDQIEVTADVSRNCILLISDNYSSGWRVRPLDDSSAQKDYAVVRADYTLRGIPLQPGKHHFLLEYMPAGYVAGKIVTLVSLLLYVVTAFYFQRPRISGARAFSAGA